MPRGRGAAARRRRGRALVLGIAAICSLAPVVAAAVGGPPETAWVAQFGTTRYDLAYAADAVDGGVYVAGFTNFQLPGQHYHHRYDAFVRRYDASGRILWTRQFGSNGVDQILAIDGDETGVLVAGSTDGRLPGQRAAGGVDAFVARFGPNGRQRWVVQFGTSANDRAAGAVLTPSGAFVAGATEGALGEAHGGASDAFVVRIDADGSFRWLRQFGTAGADEATAVAVRGRRVVVVGAATAAWRDTYLGGPADGFAAAFGANGAPRWRGPIGTAGTDRVTGIVARGTGLFLTGWTDGSFPGQPAFGGVDAFVGRLAADGSEVWFRQLGTPADDEGADVDADATGVVVTGSTTGALPGQALLGEWDAFLAAYRPNGTHRWTTQFGTDDYDRVYGLGLDDAGAFVVGTTHGAFEGRSNAGDRDVFVVRLAFS